MISPMDSSDPGQADRKPDTSGADYAERLDRFQNKRWKKILDVQAPYRWNIRRMGLNRTIDVGCGNGRNLQFLPDGSIGVDHNPHLVDSARARGLTAYTTEEFFADPTVSAPGRFDSMLASHLIEHMHRNQALEVLRAYLPSVRSGGRVVCITPQERGFSFDPTHIEYTDFVGLRQITDELGLKYLRQYSFPFPRWLGKVFVYNEFNHIAGVPDSSN